MSAAETIRRAARFMRERAAQADPGPWRYLSSGSSREEAGHRAGSESTWISAGFRSTLHVECRDFGRQAAIDADHFASWHPAVALAVADWLDDVATGWPWQTAEEVRDPDGFPLAFEESADRRALHLAKTYLGETP